MRAYAIRVATLAADETCERRRGGDGGSRGRGCLPVAAFPARAAHHGAGRGAATTCCESQDLQQCQQEMIPQEPEDGVRCPGWGPPAAEARGERPWRRRRGALSLLESEVIGFFGEGFDGDGVVSALGAGVVRAFEIRGSMLDVGWIGRRWMTTVARARFGWGCCRAGCARAKANPPSRRGGLRHTALAPALVYIHSPTPRDPSQACPLAFAFHF